MQGIICREKRYVNVVVQCNKDGYLRPLMVIWDDGRKFIIDKILESRRAASLKVGGTGIRYLCEIMGHTSYLYYENPRWFVEEKVIEMPDEHAYT